MFPFVAPGTFAASINDFLPIHMRDPSQVCQCCQRLPGNDDGQLAFNPFDLAQVVRPPKAAQLMGLSIAMFYEKSREGSDYHDPQFPKYFKISKNASAVRLKDIIKYHDILQERATQLSTSEQGGTKSPKQKKKS